MTADLVFTKQEYDQRLNVVLERTSAQERDLFAIFTPESIFYFTGVDHWVTSHRICCLYPAKVSQC
ncbi:MAG: hypothetical protein ACE5LB_09935 [Acidiferrobacterales bacterium]